MKPIVWLFVAWACLFPCSSEADEVADSTATPDPAAGTTADQAFIDAFLGFVAEPSAERLAQLTRHPMAAHPTTGWATSVALPGPMRSRPASTTFICFCPTSLT